MFCTHNVQYLLGCSPLHRGTSASIGRIKIAAAPDENTEKPELPIGRFGQLT